MSAYKFQEIRLSADGVRGRTPYGTRNSGRKPKPRPKPRSPKK